MRSGRKRTYAVCACELLVATSTAKVFFISLLRRSRARTVSCSTTRIRAPVFAARRGTSLSLCLGDKSVADTGFSHQVTLRLWIRLQLLP